MQISDLKTHSGRFPSWLKQPIISNKNTEALRKTLSNLKINTVCQSARCPNIYECFSKRRCTFLILGKFCTRACRFCAIESRRENLGGPDRHESYKILDAVRRLGIKDVVITSVTRDDLEDGGAGQFSDCIRLLRGYKSDLLIEVLVPDFRGVRACVNEVISSGPDIFSHNLETVPRLYSRVRENSNYKTSLDVLLYAKEESKGRILTKSGIMVGLGEFQEEVYNVMLDLRRVCCDIITIGQYLKPYPRCLDVEEFVRPEEFEKFSEWAKELGFKYCSSSPLTRSSYQ